VEYRGMTPSGMVRVDLYRVIRDRDTGNLTQEFWESEFVDFHRLEQTEKVAFTVPVKEFQLGLNAICVPTLSGVPAQTSQRFASLPALPDLEVVSVEEMDIDRSSPISTIRISVRNWGTVAAGSRTLMVLGSQPTAPLSFGNRTMEPLFLRERLEEATLNSSVVDISPGETLSVEMNVTLSPGMNHVWVRVKGPSWLPTPESRDYMVIPSFPQLKLTRGQLPAVLSNGSDISVKANIENTGPWSLNTTYSQYSQDLISGLEERTPSYHVDITTMIGDLGPFVNRTSLDGDLGPGETLVLDRTIDAGGTPGRRDIALELTGSIARIPAQLCHIDVLVLPEVRISIADFQQTVVGDRFTGNLDVQVHNPSTSKADVVHLTVFNGYPSDDVVISETIIMDISPGEWRTVNMELPLEKGLYVISVTAETFVVPVNGSSESWIGSDTLDGDLLVKDPGPLDHITEDDVDMGEVTTASIIAVSTMVFVLVVASFFYRRETDNGDGK
ncbi:MAG: hypothetical protein ACMUHY_08570, partial [Thermoplasmatota archaeon]